MTLADHLRALIDGEVLDDEPSRSATSRDASMFQITPRLVVAPKSSADIRRLVGYAAAHPGTCSLTARSGGTDMTGGPLTESIAVDMARHLNRIVFVSGGRAVIEPGVYYRDFERATLAKGWLLPSYPASREICTVGGMVANNAGGEKSLAYGKTIEYVESLKAILADGREYVLEPLNKKQIELKMAQHDFEGNLYRRLFELFSKNTNVIAAARPRVSKNSAGYQIWDVWNGTTFNLAKLFTGSQGTLGIITEITFRLVRPAPHSRLMVIFLRDARDLPDVVQKILPHRPESFEIYDDKTIKLALRFLPEFARLTGAKSLLSLAWKFLPEFWMAITGGIPPLVLLAEFSGADKSEVRRRTALARRDIRFFHASTRIAESAEDRRKYWALRHENFNLLRRKLRGLQAVPFIDDLIVPPERLGEFLPALRRLIAPYQLDYSIAGHAGEGNIHIITLMNLSDARTRVVVSELAPKVYDLAVSFGGSITAEHNDGLIRTPFLDTMYPPEIIEIFKEIKTTFDPNNIFNPGKKVGGNWEYALSHLRRG